MDDTPATSESSHARKAPPIAPPIAPPTAPVSDFMDEKLIGMLLEFVYERDVDCPRCGYNLRNLSRPVCPECQEELSLRIGVKKIHVAGLLLAVAPGSFCGIAFFIFIAMCMMHGFPRGMPFEALLTLTFILFSGLFTLIFATQQRRFLQMAYASQAVWVFVIWLIHFAAFVMFISNV